MMKGKKMPSGCGVGKLSRFTLSVVITTLSISIFAQAKEGENNDDQYYESSESTEYYSSDDSDIHDRAGEEPFLENSSLESMEFSESVLYFTEPGYTMLHLHFLPEGTYDITWISENPSIASVSNGIVVPHSRGITRILAIHQKEDGTSITASCEINVEFDSESNSSVYTTEEPEKTNDLIEFLNQEFNVSRYEYEVLENFKFLKIASVLIAGLLLILLFKRK